MPWFRRARQVEEASTSATAGEPAPSSSEREECKDFACMIQACLKKNGFQMEACSEKIEALRACCRQSHARASVHCTAAWVKGSEGAGGKQKK
jgi:hypothetical protein